ncbi:MAG: hypothetical protein BIFFINMI_03378 [Phycisphaerae bacterium]|nr:hypothetical protein [Phycisphaerae bacterium]
MGATRINDEVAAFGRRLPEGDRFTLAVARGEEPGDPRPVRRARWLNVVLPGGGLVLRDRWLTGLLIGLAFWFPLTTAFYFTWIAPTQLRPIWAAGLLAGAILAYVAAQIALAVVLAARDGELADYAGRTVPLLRAAYVAMSDGDWIAAQIELERLLAVDREHFEGNLTQARLLALSGKNDQARQAYARCRRLTARGRWLWEIGREVGLLPPD